MLQKQTKTILSVALFFIAYTATAQVTDFKLSDFKYRTHGFKALGLSGKTFNSFGAGSNRVSLSPSLLYQKEFSTNEKQQFLQIRPNTSFGTKKSSSSKRTTSFSIGSDINFSSIQYKPKYFTEIGFSGGTSYGNNLNYNGQENKQISYPLTGQITLGAGVGRLEFVSNAQMALFILEDLKAAGKIKGTVSKENAAAFANLITQVYNKRVFDFRKRRIYEMEQLNAFLVNNKIIEKEDITVYNIISDNWAFAIQPPAIDAIYETVTKLELPNAFNYISDRYNLDGIFKQPARYSGKQFYARVLPYYQTDSALTIKTDSTTKKYNTNFKGVSAEIGYQHRKPINLKWQLDKHATVRYSNIIVPSNVSSIIKVPNLSANIGVDVGYYPNSRTVIKGIWTFKLLQKFDKTITKNKPTWATDIAVMANYFINYNSRLTCFVRPEYAGQNYLGSGGKFYLNFDVDYTMYIF